MGTKTVLKTESFVFFDNSRFITTEYCKARITALALPVRVTTIQLFILPSVTREYYSSSIKISFLAHLITRPNALKSIQALRTDTGLFRP